MRKKNQSKTGCMEHSVDDVIVNNVDLLTEILLRVPARSLIRLKCVSKHWLSIISDPLFARSHTQRNLSSLNSALYFYRSHSSMEKLRHVSLHGHPSHPTLDFLNDVEGRSTSTRIEHSCNGLVLCSHVYKLGSLGYGTRYIVCNMFTQKYTVLPGSGGASSGSFDHKFGACLAFDPSKSPNYNVVLLSCSHSPRSYEIDMYSSKSASWKRMTETLPPGTHYEHRVFWNGAIHWMGEDNVHIQLQIDEEKLLKIQMPSRPKILDQYKIQYFGECGGSLLLVQIRRRSAKGFRILEMDSSNCCWIVKFQVNLRALISEFPEADSKFSVLSVAKGGNQKDYELVLAIPGKIISYNLKCKTLKVLDSLPKDFYLSPCYNNICVYRVFESLIPV